MTGCCVRHLRVLKKRADYLRVAGSRRRFVTPGVVVQFYRRPAGTGGEIRYGITASRRVGKAVVRNRVRRRLRAAAEQVLPVWAEEGCDYVLVGRQATASRPFDALVGDLTTALQRLRSSRPLPARSSGGGRPEGMKAATAAMRAVILCYRYALSPVLPGACRFQPSCSQYALEAVSRFGACKGGWLMLRRLARCHPWGGSGCDPVPPGGAVPPGGQDESSVAGCRQRGQGRQEYRRPPCRTRPVEE